MFRAPSLCRRQFAFLACLALLGSRVAAQGPDSTVPKLAPGSIPTDFDILSRPLESPPTTPAAATTEAVDRYFRTPVLPPLGYTGPSSVMPRESQQDPHFVPTEDRWRIGFPAWDRYGKGHPPVDDYPYVQGHWWDPYNQNVFKGDFPIIGQNTFLNITATNFLILEARQTPIATTPFESTSRPGEIENFQRPNQFFHANFVSVSLDLSHGDAGFKQPDWRIKLTPIFNNNYLAVEELAVVSPDVRKGTTRGRTWWALEEAFIESKIADTSPYFDFTSVRAGNQFFVSDFRGFIFSDTNRAVRLFGSRLSNRDEFNLIYFRQYEKDTNSFLNTFHERHQDVLIANYYRQDFIFPGYTIEPSVHYNHDSPTFKFDKNGFLVRPDPVGVFHPHTLNVCYLGFAGEGHIERLNIANALYWAVGYDSLNPLAGRSQDISAQFGAVELSYDMDWARFRGSFLWSSGDHDIRDSHATGFDSIVDNPNFAGGGFSYWQRQIIGLFGVNLTQRQSLIPDLRASNKFQSQSNFVNPGLILFNLGADFDLTPKLKMINNCNFLWFDEVNPLKNFLFQEQIHHSIGTDLSTGIEYRPFLNNNAIVVLGLSMLLPGEGFKDIYSNLGGTPGVLLGSFLEMTLTY